MNPSPRCRRREGFGGYCRARGDCRGRGELAWAAGGRPFICISKVVQLDAAAPCSLVGAAGCAGRGARLFARGKYGRRGDGALDGCLAANCIGARCDSGLGEGAGTGAGKLAAPVGMNAGSELKALFSLNKCRTPFYGGPLAVKCTTGTESSGALRSSIGDCGARRCRQRFIEERVIQRKRQMCTVCLIRSGQEQTIF